MSLTLALLAATAATPPAPPARSDAVALARSCEGKDGFSDPAPPARVFGNVWYVGTCGVTVLLITGPQGHILVDAGMEDAAPQVLANIRKLGFNPKDIGLIVSSHEHFDHVGGLAALEKATGARFVATAEAAKVIRSGKVSPADPQAQEIHGSRPARVDFILKTGDVFSVGPLKITAFATPGHTEGSTSWHWKSCEGSDCRTITYVDSLTALPLGTYRFADHPERVAMFRKTFAQVEALECGILLTPHPSSSAMFERMSGAQPLEDRKACKALVAGAKDRLERAIAK
ncbi:subclass B3 metallo-beta-lactamase [Novosphingobium jiangmenense]|uniref:Subclass B3 metallo-beta-lactamase n=1 Tax=Novosphingobium jiangmenense TaxID=2791981 RepID=A0ABS0HGT0_9SPHN|nr:subclass B3 metallo-beta-lactamase [Novosphingobium jiangmenense]MBF9151455.1 subclass B3 metallo-beta-lactamase [Novosphingobium jiangmenense]